MQGKSIIKGIASVLVSIFLAYFVYLLNRAEPDVRYTLSDKIPYTVNNKPTETVQQMEVRNIGNAPAKKIVLRMPGVINILSLDKYSQADNVQIFQKNGLEIDYPELPPQGRFKIVFTNPNGVDDRDVTIFHSGGQGIAALSKEKSSEGWGSLLLRIGVPIGLLLFMLQSLRKSAIDLIEISRGFKDIENMLVAEQPWYMTGNEWSRLLRKSILEKINSRYFSKFELQNSNAYKILNAEKPEAVSDPLWKEIQEKSTDTLKKDYGDALAVSYLADTLINLLRIEKPLHFPLHLWEELEKKTCEAYIRAKKGDPLLPDSKWAYERLQDAKPKELPDAYWQKYQDYMRNQYCSLLKSEIQTKDDPVAFIHAQDLTVLSHDEVDSVNRYAIGVMRYKHYPTTCDIDEIEPVIINERPEWLTNGQFDLLKRVSKKLKEAEVKSKESDEIIEKVSLLLEKEPLGETKPSRIPDYIWQKLKSTEALLQMLSTLEQREQQVSATEQDLKEAADRNKELRDKIEKQLHFIHELLIDPSFADRIEDYSNVFAPKNFDNLRRIAFLNQQAAAK